jgi:hypothetical protein
MKEDKYRVMMNRRWTLEDLSAFPNTYAQAYYFTYCLDSELEEPKIRRINTALESYPWKGGYSYLNIYTVLAGQVPKKHRPTIAAIQYASPGFIDILLDPVIALQVAKSVGIFLGTGVVMTETYARVHKVIQDIAKARKTQQKEIAELAATEAQALVKLSETLAENLGFGSVAKLTLRTKNIEVTLKLLMAHHRRLSSLGAFVIDGKIALPETLPDEANDKLF